MPGRPIRILTSTAAYDGHDASILALNQALLAGQEPVEVLYLGFNMTSGRIASAALQEGVDAVAVSSYNGGHLQFFPHLVHLLKEGAREKILVFGGGGGTIIPKDIESLESAGVEKIYEPGWPLDAIAADMLQRINAGRLKLPDPPDPELLQDRPQSQAEMSSLLSLAENSPELFHQIYGKWLARTENLPGCVIAFCGDGGVGKSTLIDELVHRFLTTFENKTIAILANDPTLEQGGVLTALLADRVRMNYIYDDRVWMRSIATRNAFAPFSPALPTLVKIFLASSYDLVIVETPGSGQTGLDLSSILPNLVVCIKTCEYGDSLQLQKDQLFHRADIVVLNKADMQSAETAFGQFKKALEDAGKGQTLLATTAKSALDPGVGDLFTAICRRIGWTIRPIQTSGDVFHHAGQCILVPHRRRAYLAEIADKVRAYDNWMKGQLKKARAEPGDLSRLDPQCALLLREWQNRWHTLSSMAGDAAGIGPVAETPNGLRLPRVAVPDQEDVVETLRFLLEEGLPGQFPYATGIYAYRPVSARETVRQFAGLRSPEETNRRLHLLAQGVAKPRLSIAFDGITLYGDDSDEDAGSIGKIGEGGVPIDTWEDMKLVLNGFSIRDISTSMTINGPAPVILAMYLIAAEEIEVERISGKTQTSPSEAERTALRRELWAEVRGTIQADILKEVQAQNESIFQPEFAIRLLGDVQQWFIDNGVKKFYSMSISGYHIGEAGASPVQELAFALSNGFTYIENFRARGMAVNDFAPNLSFFFKVSHEAEWLVYGAVCRRIWAIALRDVYGADARSQKLKFHSQTSGRALQAEEWDALNPVRLTYHALLGLLANSNSLHVDSADEPMTTPGEKWVRQASRIPSYLREEAEGFVIQNLLSGSYAFRTLMREVQAQVLEEFDRLDRLGGVGPAMERGYQRRCIAESSARYERQRARAVAEQSGDPVRKIIGYNTFELPDGHPDKYPPATEMIRPTPRDWELQVARVRDFRKRHAEDAPIYLERLRKAALGGENVFAELLETVRHATLGQITRSLTDVGGRYRKTV